MSGKFKIILSVVEKVQMAPSFNRTQLMAILLANTKLKASVSQMNTPHEMKEAKLGAVICD